MKKLSQLEEKFLVSQISSMFEKFDNARNSQLNMIEKVQNAIYEKNFSNNNSWHSKINLPEVYELSQTLKSHLLDNLFSNPESMFDVQGVEPKAQKYANQQKSMVVSALENMKFNNEIEKIVDNIVETGEATLFVGWKSEKKKFRRPQTLEEQLLNPSEDGYIIEKKISYDAPIVRVVNAKNFVFDISRRDNWNSCPKIFRSFLDPHNIKADISNNMLTREKSNDLVNLANSDAGVEQKNVFEKQVEILEFWGDIALDSGEILEDCLITIAGRQHIIRFEENPFVINPFIYANIIEDPFTKRGISPLNVALTLNSLSSTVLNKQLDALSLIMNPPYLAPKGAFKGKQKVQPGEIVEYDPSLMPIQPMALRFDSALVGWDFIKYFKSQTESATGIFKNMAGDIQPSKRTATELNYTISGQSTRLNLIIDSIYKKLLLPCIEKIADLLASFKYGKEAICIKKNGKFVFVDIDDEIRNANYIYHYGDRKVALERKAKSKELFEIILALSKMPNVSQNVNWIECFKFALEQYGIENVDTFLNYNSQIMKNT